MSVDSTVLEEEFDNSFEPSDEEVMEYAMWLGFDLPKERQLLWIAKNGLQARLPVQWKPCRTEEDEIYYFNFDTGESSWDHPCDDAFRHMYKNEAQKLVRKPQQMPLQAAVPRVGGEDALNNGGLTSVSESREVSPAPEKNSGRLVVKWKSALNGRKQGDEEDVERKRAELKEKMRISTNDPEQGKRQPAKNGDMQKQHDAEYEKQRLVVLQEIDKTLAMEKKILHEKDVKMLQREMQRERELLELQETHRRRVLEAKLKVEREADFKREEELDSRKMEREKDFKALVDEELDSFEAIRREKLQQYRQDLADKESQRMQHEREEMARRVRKALKVYELVTTEELKAEMLNKVQKNFTSFKMNVAAGEFHELVRDIIERVTQEGEKIQKELGRVAAVETADLKQTLLARKRQETLMDVELLKAELKSEIEKLEMSITEALEKSKDQRSERHTPEETTPQSGSVQTKDDGVLAMQRAACELLLNMVLKDKDKDNERKESCNCEAKNRVLMKAWLAGFEKKVRKLMLAFREETREAIAGLQMHLVDERNLVQLTGRGNCSCQLMCNEHLHGSPYCRAQVIQATECRLLRNPKAAKGFHSTVSLNPDRSSACSCDSFLYYDGPCRRPRTTDRHIGKHCTVNNDSDADIPVTSKFKREKSILKDKNKRNASSGNTRCHETSTIGSKQLSSSHKCDKRAGESSKSEEVDQESTSNADEPRSSLSNSSCNSGSSAASTAKRRRGGRLNRIRKGLFVVKGKLLKWSRRPANSRSTPSGIRKSDLAKIQLECRKKLRQLPVGIRCKVARHWPQHSKHFCAAVDEWPNLLEVDSPDFLKDALH